MRLRTLIPLAAVALGAVPAAASADTLLVPTPQGSQNLQANGGYMTWAQPNQPAGSGWRIVVRAPDGSVSKPDIPVSEDVPQPTIGTDTAFPRNLLLVYARRGDVYTYDLRRRVERKLRAISSSATEATPTMTYGRVQFVRRDGRRPGIYTWTARSGLRRVVTATPRELASNGSRIAYPTGNTIVVRRVSGDGRPFLVRAGGRPESILLSRYRASWIVGDEAYKTGRFGGSGPAVPGSVDRGGRAIPGVVSIALGRGDRVRYALDAEGVKELSPTPFGSRG